MSYATQQDLIDWCGLNGSAELVELTDPNNATINSLIVANKLNQACNEINARLTGIDLPFAPPYPKLLVVTECKIARYFLYPTGRPDYVEADYKDAIALLKDVQSGKASIGLDGSGVAELGASPAPYIIASDRVFTDDQLGKMIAA